MIPLDVLLTFNHHLQRGIMARSEFAPRCIAKTNVLHVSLMLDIHVRVN